MKLDILAIGAHPDDVEIGCSGTLMKQIDKGYKVGIADLTQGELGTRGTAKIRMEEVEESTRILGVHARENLGFEDGFFRNDKEHQLALIKIIRKYRPEVVITNAKYDRHPDHGRAAELVYDACFYSGLRKIETTLDGVAQTAFRPRALYNYVQAIHNEPQFVVDISDYFERKMKAIEAFKSQFHNPNSKEPEKEPTTFISTVNFYEFIKARALHFGVPSGAKYAEAFMVNRLPAVDDIMHLL